MILLVAGLLATATVAVDRQPNTVCEVGRAAIRDLPPVVSKDDYDTYYAGDGQVENEIMSACPKLKRLLPQGYRMADLEAYMRASVGAPIPGKVKKPAYIYAITLTELSTDRKFATVNFDVKCSGLCGSRREAKYLKGPTGWQLVEIKTLYVS